MPRRFRQPAHRVEPFQHLAHVKQNRIRTPLFHVRVKVARVGSDHDPSATCANSHHLQPHRMPSDVVQCDSRSQLVIAIVKRDAAFEDPLDYGRHVGSLKRESCHPMAHVASCTERHLAILNVVPRGWEFIQAAGVIVMHVRDDHILYLRRIDADHLQPFGRRPKQLALAFARHLRIEAGIDYERSLFTYNCPHEEVDGHGSIVRIAAQKVLAGPPWMVRVTDRVDFVSIRFHLVMI